jgi:hypothetical protein
MHEFLTIDLTATQSNEVLQHRDQMRKLLAARLLGGCPQQRFPRTPCP